MRKTLLVLLAVVVVVTAAVIGTQTASAATEKISLEIDCLSANEVSVKVFLSGFPVSYKAIGIEFDFDDSIGELKSFEFSENLDGALLKNFYIDEKSGVALYGQNKDFNGYMGEARVQLKTVSFQSFDINCRVNLDSSSNPFYESVTVPSFHSDGVFYYSIQDGYARVIGCVGAVSGKITIPEKFGDYIVTNIAAGLFANCSSLTSIVIPEGVTIIGDRTFSGCSSLTNVEIPDSVTSIGDNAFGGCRSLTSIEIPDSVNSIGYEAFYNCSSLKSIEIPDSVKSIGNYAFEGCSSLTSVYITDIAAWCNISFANNISHPLNFAKNLYLNNELVTELVIPSSVTQINNFAFYNCESLTSVEIPDSVNSIGNYAFRSCSNLTSVEIGNGVNSIGEYAFYYCSSLTSIEIPNSVTSIGDSAFYYCDSLTSVEIPDSVTSVGNYAFYDCGSLTSVVIPNSVTSIGKYTFYYCSSLKKVYYPGSSDDWSKISIGSYNSPLTNATKVYNYLGNDGVFKYIKNGDSASVCGCIKNDVTSIVIPEEFKGYKVTAINSSAFENLATLKDVTISTSVTSIGERAFFGCSSLTGVYISDIAAWCSIEFGNSYSNPLYYAKNLYLNNELVKELVIPDGLTSIGMYSFNSCSSLKKVYYPGSSDDWSKISIGSYNSPLTNATKVYNYLGNDGVFIYTKNGDSASVYGCMENDVTSIVIPEEFKGYKVTAINSSAFENLATLKDVTFSTSVTSIGERAFSGCSSLTSIEIPDSVTSIGEYAFNNCSSLTGVYISDIAAWCSIEFGNSYSNPLYYAKNLYLNNELVIELVIPDELTSIGMYSFYNCSNLTSVVIPASVTRVNNFAFSSCGSLKTVYYSGSSSEWSEIYIDASSRLLSATKIYNCLGTDGTLAYVKYNDEAQVYGFFGEATASITIPSEFGGYKVTSIRNSAFYNCSSLTSVVIGDGVTSIGYSAFSGCTGLTSVKIGDGVTFIRGSAFSGCTGLTSIEIPDSVTRIEYGAFKDCTELASIKLPDRVMIINDDAFDNTRFYKNEDNWKNKVFYIGKHLIQSKDIITGAYTVKEGTLDIAIEAFNGRVGLTGITFADSVEYIGDYAFYGCTRLTEISLPGSVKSVGSACFANCSAMESFKAENGLEEIGSDAFSRCYNLKTVELPKSVTKIGYRSFRDCSSLKNIVLPENLETIEYALFIRAGLTSIEVPKNVTEIAYAAFANCTGLKSVNMPKSAKSITIEEAAFENCYYLTDIDFSENLTKIGEKAFMGCSRLNSVEIPESVTEIAYKAFASCWGLQSVSIPKTAQSITIGNAAFEYCTNLSNVKLPENLTEIGRAAFYHCSGLKKLIIQNGLVSIGSYAFEYSGLTKIQLPKSLETVKFNAFAECQKLTDVYYEGSESDWQNVTVNDGNLYLLVANFHYNSTMTPPGDLDGVEGVTSDDAIFLLYSVLFGEETYPITQEVDFDGNDVVDSDDAIYLLYHVLFGEESYPLK